MKKVITGLLFATSLSIGNAQSPPTGSVGAGGPLTPAAPATTGSAPIATTSAPGAPATTTPPQVVAPAVTVPPGGTVPVIPATTPAQPVATPPAPPATPQTTTATPPVITPPVTPPAPPAVTTPPVVTTPVTPPAPPAPQPPPINPYCPAGVALNVLGQRSNPMLPPGFSLNQDAECRSNVPGNPESRAIDFEGMLNCGNYACCLCQEISCGASGWPCEHLKIGDSGAVGVQNINAIGLPSTSFWTGTSWSSGAQIDCSGLEACKMSKIRGKNVGQMQCSGDYGCQGADISYECTEQSKFQCNGLFGCAASKIEVVIPANVMEVDTIEFNGQQAAQGATLTIKALGAQATVRNLECMNPTACINLKINVIGNVWFENCDLQGMQNLNTLPTIIQQCALAQGGNFGNFPGGFFPNQPYPQYPQYPPFQPPQVPVTPSVPAPPAQPVTPVAPPQPVQPAPPAQPAAPLAPLNPLTMLPLFNSQNMKCMGNQCMNRPMTVQVSNNFVFECLGTCTGMDLTLNVGYDPMNMGHPVERIDSLKFITPNSGVGATIRINTAGVAMYAGLIEVNDIRCEGFGSCRNMKVYVDGGVDLWNLNFDCNTPNECLNCKVFQNGGTGIDCFMLSGNGMFGGGMFLPQTPGLFPGYPQPAAPAQPQQPAPPTYPTYPQQPVYPQGYYPFPQFI